jgi:uncharacterized repeat protein (TIGR01451 family)
MARKRTQVSSKAIFGLFLGVALLVGAFIYAMYAAANADQTAKVTTYIGTVRKPANLIADTLGYYRLMTVSIDGRTVNREFSLVVNPGSNLENKVKNNVGNTVQVTSKKVVDLLDGTRGIEVLTLTPVTASSPSPSASTSPSVSPSPSPSASAAPSASPTVSACRMPIDIVYTVDTSKTMTTGTPKNSDITKAIIAQAKTHYTANDRVALVSFGASGATRDLAFSTDYNGLSTKVDALAYGDTNSGNSSLASGVKGASDYIESDTAGAANHRTVVIITDGRSDGMRQAVDTAKNDFNDNNVRYYVLQVLGGDAADSDQLKDLARHSDGKYLRVKSVNQATRDVTTLFEQLTETFDCQLSGVKFQDSNANGMKDEGESGLAGWKIELLKADAQGNFTKVDETTTKTSRVANTEGNRCPRYRTLSGRPSWETKSATILRLDARNDKKVAVVKYTATGSEDTLTISSSVRRRINHADLPAPAILYFYAEDILSGGAMSKTAGCVEFPSDSSDGVGSFSFTHLAAGRYKLREVRGDATWTLTTPTAESDIYTMPVHRTSLVFGNAQLNPLGLTVTLQADKTGVRNGDEVVLTYTVKNPSGTTAKNATITQPLPAGLTETASGAASLTITIGELKAGETVTKTTKVTYREN